MKVDIAFILGSLQSGGAERVASNLCNSWSEIDGVNVELVTGDLAENDFYKLSNNITRTSLKFNYRSKNKFSFVFEQFRRFFILYGFLRSRKSKVLVLSGTDISIRFLFSLLFFKNKVIVCEHNNYYAYKNRLKRVIRLIAFFRADKLFVLTDRDKKVYSKKNPFKRESTSVMVNPLTELPGQGVISNKTVSKPVKLLSVGRLVEQKGYDRLMSIVSNLKIDFQLTIIGEGNLKDEIQNLINKYELSDRVQLVGLVSNIEDYYRDSDILLLTSYYEGLPMVLIEANSFSLPLISFDCPTGPRELIKNELNGFLVNDGNETEFIEKVELLATDQVLYSQLAHNAYSMSLRFSLNNINNKWFEHIVELDNR
ncbi:glycosyltransferase family 4 protein [Endozoicomonas sp. ALC020]|uniref:glycosyltransferase family 4 protein n=2 Tax=unclassified Endozoicomonas TaxID=2644528 RepID=UPI003BB12779